MNNKTVVITGSTRGIGFGLAGSFLSKGHNVVINGRSEQSLDNASSILMKTFGKEKTGKFIGNTTNPDDMKDLWQYSITRFGKVDIWINNAGLGQPEISIEEIPFDKAEEMIHTNICGVIAGTQAALSGMKKQGHGSIYLMEGLGSDGRIVPKVSVYGATKYAVRYLIRALAIEAKNSGILIGGLSPGMVATDLLTAGYDKNSEEWKRVKNIFNILADDVKTVTPWLVSKILSNKTNGKTIKWLTTGKIISRFLSSPFIKRYIID